MASNSEVANKLREYLGHKIDEQSFRRWVVLRHVEVASHHMSLDEAEARLLYEVEAAYAEHSDSNLPEARLRECLSELLSVSAFPYAISAPATGSTTTAMIRASLDWAADPRAVSSVLFGDRRFASVY
jgi:hypothetical protein